MSIQLTSCKFNTRGKGTREVTYQGIGKLVLSQVPVKDEETGKTVKKNGKVVTEEKQTLDPTDAVTAIADALELESGNMQALLNHWAIGKNLELQTLASDRLAQYVDSSWDKDMVKEFKKAVNGMIGMLPEDKVTDAVIEKAVKAAKQFIS